MWNKLTDYYFWFTQPSSILSSEDKFLFFTFVGITAVAIIVRSLAAFSKNPVNRKALMKIWLLGLSIGLSGLVWFGMRYENTYIFAKRFWAGSTLVIGLIWLLFIVKYLIFGYRTEKIAHEKEAIKNKYLPKANA